MSSNTEAAPGTRAGASAAAAAEARRYRHRNRARPCEQCRRHKVKCQQTRDSPGPCVRCQRSKVPCSLLSEKGGPFIPSRGGASMPETGVTLSLGGAGRLPSEAAPGSYSGDSVIEDTHQTLGLASGGSAERMTPWLPSQRLSTQLSQQLDRGDEHPYQVFGASSEADPWLLRHMRFDEAGQKSFVRQQFRNCGATPTHDKIPAHFLILHTSLADTAVTETETTVGRDLKQDLADLVETKHGPRLVRLFFKHVFPTLPVLSRTQFGVATANDLPSPQYLDELSPILLAAIYGAALPHYVHDEALMDAFAYERLPLHQVWRLVYQQLQEEIHRPRLAVIQAGLLYLHRDNQQLGGGNALPDTPFTCSFLGSMVGLANSMGLQLESSPMGIPAWEKRLRRRIWWTLYVEDKLLSLLLSRPPYIRVSEWDVDELDERDFALGQPVQGTDTAAWTASCAAVFLPLMRLSRVADNIQSSLYSLRQCQRLAPNLSASISEAQPLFVALESCCTDQAFSSSGTDGSVSRGPYPSALAYLIHLTLRVYIWRAVMRATVKSLPPPQIIDPDQPPQGLGMSWGDLVWDISSFPQIALGATGHETQETDHDAAEEEHNSVTVRDLYRAARVFAGTLVDFVSGLSATDNDSYWPPCTRHCFAIMSSFLLVLLVQAPDYEGAVEANMTLKSWRQLLCRHSRGASWFLYPLARLNTLYNRAMDETFYLPDHVQAVLRETSGS